MVFLSAGSVLRFVKGIKLTARCACQVKLTRAFVKRLRAILSPCSFRAAEDKNICCSAKISLGKTLSMTPCRDASD